MSNENSSKLRGAIAGFLIDAGKYCVNWWKEITVGGIDIGGVSTDQLPTCELL